MKVYKITLDRPRKLGFTTEGVARVLEVLGITSHDQIGDRVQAEPSPERRLAMSLWAALVADDPDLTIGQVEMAIEARCSGRWGNLKRNWLMGQWRAFVRSTQLTQKEIDDARR